MKAIIWLAENQSFHLSSGFLRRRGHRKGWENLPHSGQVRVVFNLWSHKGTDFFITWRERDIYLCPYWSKFIEIYDLVLFSWNNSAIPKYQLPCTSWWVWTFFWPSLFHSCRNNDGNLEEDEFIKVTFDQSSWKVSFFHVPLFLEGLPGGRGAVGFAERPWSEITIRQITKATKEILEWHSLDWRCIRYCRPKLTALFGLKSNKSLRFIRIRLLNVKSTAGGLPTSA